MQNIAFSGLKTNIETGRKVLSSIKKELPYVPSSTRIQSQIIRHEDSARFHDIIPKLDELSDKYDKMSDQIVLSTRNTTKDFIDDIKRNKVGNCGEMNQLLEQKLIDEGIDAHGISMLITNQSDGKLKERIADHLFVVFGLKKNADMSNIKTWGNNAVIVDAWANIVMSAQEGFDYLKKMFGFNPKIHNIEYEHSMNMEELSKIKPDIDKVLEQIKKQISPEEYEKLVKIFKK